METNVVLTIFLIFFFSEYIFETFLVLLNLSYLKKNAQSVPDVFLQYIDPETGTKAAEYTTVKSRFSLVAAAFSSILLLVFVVFGFFGSIDRMFTALNLNFYFHGILYIAAVSFIFSLFSLPFSLYGQFVIEERFGFNKMTVTLFFRDRLKALLISVLIGVPLLLGLFFFMEVTGPFWWLFALGFFTLIQFVLSIVYPAVIAPLFNKFSPLPEGVLKTKIEQLLHSLDYKTRGIFIMDGSKRSRHSNAYFTGFGKTKRIVLFDTLVNTLSEDEICGVFAHELGHEKRGHIWKNIMISIAGSAAGFFILSLLLQFPPLFYAFGFSAPSYHGLLILVSLCAGPFTFFLKPIFTALSRKHEYEADRFSKQALGGDYRPLQRALIKLSRDNLSNLHPHPLYSFFNYSHPTLQERIRALERS